MFKYEGKEIDELDLKEVFEFEKDLYKKILQAHNAGMSSGITDQLNYALQSLKFRKQELLYKERVSWEDKQDEKHKDGLIIGENESEQSDDPEGE